MSKEWRQEYDKHMSARRKGYKERKKFKRRGGGEIGSVPGRSSMEGGRPRNR